MRFPPRVVAMACLAILGACSTGGDGGTAPRVPDNSPATIVLAPAGATTLQSGTTSSIVASVFAKDGHALATSVSWSSGDATIATVAAGAITGAKAGTTIVTATAGTISASVSVTVTPGTPSQLAIRAQPLGATVGAALAAQPVIEIRDAAGNIVTSATATVAATIATGGGTLNGTTSVAAVSGIATFTDLSIAGAAGDRTLTFSATGLSSATSSAVTMTPPPTPLIVLDARAVAFGTTRGFNPAAATVRITNGGAQPLVGVTTGSIAYDAGQPTGWLSASLDSPNAPATLTLRATAAALGAGTYHAVVPIVGPGAPNSPVSLSVTLTVLAGGIVSYGSAAEKVKVLDVNATFAPSISVADSSGVALPGVAVTYASRSSGVLRVAADGKITATSPGDGWVTAETAVGRDSIFVIVPPSSTGPIIRSDMTTWVLRVGDTAFVNVVLDTRGSTVGSGSFSVGIQVNPSVFSSILYNTPSGSPVPVVNGASPGVLRVTVAAATGMTGKIALVNLKLVGRSTAAGQAGWLTFSALDVSAVDGSSLTPQMTSTRLPLVIR